VSLDQPALFGDLPAPGPPGFDYRAGFVSFAEEEALAGQLADLPFSPFQFRGYEGRRRVVSFGLHYDFNGAGLVEAAEIPAWLLPLRAAAAGFAGLAAEAFVHVLINEYRPGAPIGWHRDRPAFDKVVGVSLLAPTTMRFRRRIADGFERMSAVLEPRSAYLLDGPARREWEHSLPEAAALRYSITFRNLNR
jgi:alkylated DNA repair dioxygenase AlkB